MAPCDIYVYVVNLFTGIFYKENNVKNFVKKLSVLAILGLACVFAVSGQTQTVANMDAAMQQAIKDINLKLAMGPKVALLNFSSSDDLSAHVLREMALAMEKSKNCSLITRANIDNALRGQNLKSSGDVTDAQAGQLCKALGAQFVVTGSLVKTGADHRFRMRLLNSNGQAQATTDITVKDNSQIQQLLGEAPAPAPVPVVTPSTAPGPATVVTPTPAPAVTGTYHVGGKGPAGGLIFYDKGNNNGGWQYLEAAPADLSNKLTAVRENIKTDDCGERAVGKGKSNTDAIMKEAAAKGGGFGWAAQACAAYTLNGFKDWFLPSRDELHQMYGNLHMQGFGDFKNEWYWTSTFYDGYFLGENFADGKQDTHWASREFRVRPIRQF